MTGAQSRRKREARERRVWTARRVVVGRASHDELFFKIASTSPTTRKQKKPENSLSTRSFSRSQRDDKGCLGECDDEMSRLGMCSDVKGRGGIGWCKAIGDGGGFVSVCADPGLPLALMCLPLLPPAVADAVAALGEVRPCGGDHLAAPSSTGASLEVAARSPAAAATALWRLRRLMKAWRSRFRPSPTAAAAARAARGCRAAALTAPA